MAKPKSSGVAKKPKPKAKSQGADGQIHLDEEFRSDTPWDNLHITLKRDEFGNLLKEVHVAPKVSKSSKHDGLASKVEGQAVLLDRIAKISISQKDLMVSIQAAVSISAVEEFQVALDRMFNYHQQTKSKYMAVLKKNRNVFFHGPLAGKVSKVKAKAKDKPISNGPVDKEKI